MVYIVYNHCIPMRFILQYPHNKNLTNTTTDKESKELLQWRRHNAKILTRGNFLLVISE